MPQTKSSAKASDASATAQGTSTSSRPISVLFVCLGNICRSPMAEAVFASLTASNPGVARIDSAGTGAYHAGDSPDSRTMDTLAENNINDYDHAARKMVATDFTDFDYILAMDEDNLDDLESMRRRLMKKDSSAASHRGQLMLFGDFGGKKGEQVVDPYYGARNGFSVAYEQMVRFTTGFVEQVLTKVENPKNA
ncbi:uncharacterized protein KY384_006203 [Bacidia gigantensis]|uniref:uncharacterized protein n=1 Tax=Bacidia gigantensis TaxID=2732470 RepID=UPI001D05B5E1|nr:uncharacterized protein KY384_006203 [Bacidia gigantensis]KAG8529566.1 hypothetical protein KY384_006203 [Bacidia gigantensis]